MTVVSMALPWSKETSKEHRHQNTIPKAPEKSEA